MEREYKSPLKKLAKFFEQSRDRWKKRAINLSKDVIRYKNRIKFLESSKSKIKTELKLTKEKLMALECELKKNNQQ